MRSAGGRPSPALATNALVGRGAPADRKIVLATHRNLYVLRVQDLGIAARFSPTDELDKGCAPCGDGKVAPPRSRTGFYVTSPVIAGKHVYVARDDGSQLVLDLDTAQLVAPDEFAQDAANESYTFTRGQPAIADGMAVFGSVNGIFAYRMNATSPPPTPAARRFTSTEDAHVNSASASKNYGADKSLIVRQKGSETYRFYLKFELRGLTGRVTGALLGLYVKDASPDCGRVFAVGNEWSESKIAWSTAPAMAGPGIAPVAAPKNGRWDEVDLARAITADGTYGFVLAGTSCDSAAYESSESSHKPQLVVTTG